MEQKLKVRLTHYLSGGRRWVIVCPKGYWIPELLEGPTTAFPGHRSYGFGAGQSLTMSYARDYADKLVKESA